MLVISIFFIGNLLTEKKTGIRYFICCRPNATLFRIWFGTSPNRKFDFEHPKSEFPIWNIHVRNVTISQIQLGISRIRSGTYPTMSQIHLGEFGTWSDLVSYIPNLFMSQIYLDGFGIWSGLVSYVRNLTMTQIYLDIFGTWSSLGY